PNRAERLRPSLDSDAAAGYTKLSSQIRDGLDSLCPSARRRGPGTIHAGSFPRWRRSPPESRRLNKHFRHLPGPTDPERRDAMSPPQLTSVLTDLAAAATVVEARDTRAL